MPVQATIVKTKQLLTSALEYANCVNHDRFNQNSLAQHLKGEMKKDKKFTRSVKGQVPTMPENRVTTVCEANRCACGFIFVDSDELTKHKEVHKSNSWWCSECPREGDEAWDKLCFQLKKKDYGADLPLVGQELDTDAKERRIKQYRKKVKGPFTSHQSMWKHFRTVHLGRYTHYCDKCVYGNDDRDAMAAHRYREHQLCPPNGVYTCKLRCQKIFTSRRAYEIHSTKRVCEMLGQARRYKCTVCPKHFISVKTLTLHCAKQHVSAKRLRNEEPPVIYKCAECPQYFASVKTLSLHCAKEHI